MTGYVYDQGWHDERARLAVGTGPARLKIHPGWWRTEPCHCRLTLASSNHPAWHYHPATASDTGAWRGAEVRIVFRLSAHELSE